jgi:hypothetical protein
MDGNNVPRSRTIDRSDDRQQSDLCNELAHSTKQYAQDLEFNPSVLKSFKTCMASVGTSATLIDLSFPATPNIFYNTVVSDAGFRFKFKGSYSSVILI